MATNKPLLNVHIGQNTMDSLKELYESNRNRGQHGSKKSFAWFIDRILGRYVMDNMRIRNGKLVSVDDLDVKDYEY